MCWFLCCNSPHCLFFLTYNSFTYNSIIIFFNCVSKTPSAILSVNNIHCFCVCISYFLLVHFFTFWIIEHHLILYQEIILSIHRFQCQNEKTEEWELLCEFQALADHFLMWEWMVFDNSNLSDNSILSLHIIMTIQLTRVHECDSTLQFWHFENILLNKVCVLSCFWLLIINDKNGNSYFSLKWKLLNNLMQYLP